MKSLKAILFEMYPGWKNKYSYNKKYGVYNSDVKLRTRQDILKALTKATAGMKWVFDYNKNIFATQGHNTNKEFKLGLPLKNDGYWVISTYENGDFRDTSKSKDFDQMLKILNRLVK